MKTSSAKAKGRRLLQQVKETLLEWAPDLHPDDIQVTPSGVPGPDLYFSPKAREIYDFDVEGKNQEALNIWGAMRQLYERKTKLDEKHKEAGTAHGTTHLLCFSRNREKRVYVCLDLEDFLRLIR